MYRRVMTFFKYDLSEMQKFPNENWKHFGTSIIVKNTEICNWSKQEANLVSPEVVYFCDGCPYLLQHTSSPLVARWQVWPPGQPSDEPSPGQLRTYPFNNAGSRPLGQNGRSTESPVPQQIDIEGYN